MRQVLSHILLGLAASSYASAQTMAEADFLIDNGPQPNMPAGAKSYSLNWIVGKYPPIVGVHPGDKVVFAYDSAHNVFKLSDQKSFESCDMVTGSQLDTTTTPYPASGMPFSMGTPRASYTLTIPALQDSNPLYAVCGKVGHCSAGQKIAFAILPNYAELNTDESTLDSRAITMVWNDTITYDKNQWLYLIPGDRVLMSYPASNDVWELQDKRAWEMCDFTNAVQLDTGSNRMPFTDINSQEPRAAYELAANRAGDRYVTSKGTDNNCLRGQKIKINVFGPTADQATFTSVPGVTQTPGANSHLDAMSASSSASAPLTALLGLCVAAVLAL